ncbi:hypothetical protein Daesc_003451 [Daldinia eschscholtzii]|uniref:Stc1 domain-containing protein n=1 Tax=Daldinia eschscholtzii TaxID=292717 RepID=A0AAX6MTT0_9PEZI
MARGDNSPQKFMCAAGGEWLAADKFSRNQMSKWQRIRGDDGVTPQNAGLICKEHTKQTAAPQEIKCSGPCGLWKHKDHFSKVQRNDPDAQCISCTLWACNYTGDEDPPAPPNSHMPAHEIMAQATDVQDEAPDFAAPGAALGTRPGQALPAYHDAHNNGVEVGEIDESVLRSITSMMRVTAEGQLVEVPPTNPDHRGPARVASHPATEYTIDGGYLQTIAASTVTADANPNADLNRLYGYSPFYPVGRSVQTTINSDSDERNGESGDKSRLEVPEDKSGRTWFRGSVLPGAGLREPSDGLG